MTDQKELDFLTEASAAVFVVTYTGPFAFIKPWTAVRDAKTYSQTFLTPSILEGLRIRLGVSTILRHRLTFGGMDVQLERTQTAGWKETKGKMERQRSILERGVLVQPCLKLAFASLEDAVQASKESICLCRNEDLLFPVQDPEPMSISDFELLEGYELLFGESDVSFLVGYNRYQNAAPMYGQLIITRNE
jgi:hypothetical protein